MSKNAALRAAKTGITRCVVLVPGPKFESTILHRDNSMSRKFNRSVLRRRSKQGLQLQAQYKQLLGLNLKRPARVLQLASVGSHWLGAELRTGP